MDEDNDFLPQVHNYRSLKALTIILLCLAATHDIELCGLLQDSFDLYHFEEQVGENKMLFDYVIRS